MAQRLFDDDFLQRLQRLGMIARRLPSTAASAGQRRSRRIGDGLEFADHRAYAPGDDLRFLDWPYYARMEKLLLRLFHEHSEGAVSVLVDCSASMDLGEVNKFDYARRGAAALAYVAMCSLDKVNILPFGGDLSDGMQTGRNRGQILQVLEFLEGVRPGGKTSLEKSVERFVNRHAEKGAVFILTDLFDVEEELSTALLLLRQRRDEVVLLHVADRNDADPPLRGPSQLSAVEAGQNVNLNVTEEVLVAYAKRWRQFVLGAEKTCLGRGATYVQANTWTPFERLILETLRRAGVIAE
jgi:uncharacterized protein (DUF58 family)